MYIVGFFYELRLCVCKSPMCVRWVLYVWDDISVRDDVGDPLSLLSTLRCKATSSPVPQILGSLIYALIDILLWWVAFVWNKNCLPLLSSLDNPNKYFSCCVSMSFIARKGRQATERGIFNLKRRLCFLFFVLFWEHAGLIRFHPSTLPFCAT